MNNQKGLAPIVILIIIAILGVIGVVAYRNQNISQNKTTTLIESLPSNSPTPTAKPIIINKVVSPTSSPKTTASPIPSSTSTPSQISCEITTSPTEGWAPMTVNLSQHISSSTGASGLQWDYDGDGNWDTEMVLGNYSPQYTYQKAGNYTVKLNVRTSQGDTSCTKTITVKPASVECKVYADKTSGQAPLEVDFSYEAQYHGTWTGGDISKAQWDFDGDGNWDTPFDFSSIRLKHTYSQPGNYTVKMHIGTNSGYTSDTCTGNISVQ